MAREREPGVGVGARREGASMGSRRPARLGDAAMTSGVAGAGEGLHPFKKGTFRLLTMRLKIVSPKENLGWGWQLEAS